ncbi:hypothetical protein L5515_010860 [Caenorhabditis briggsae]|uniref:G-protein coupled receptors family 1 profile domain-containing protein n=1 Tax=Caenorhabditis briggsae TaxID=6238 RepID=A0AAE9JFN1_CAEBR|nr:hypothetical protein L5515_010860 [Caenorhabditis briggsae]
MISEETYQIHRIIIYCIVLFFEIFGLFGNLNLIVLTIRKKSLRTKYGYILCTLATIHTLCLLYELVCMGFGVAATFYSYDIRRKTCFLAIFPYMCNPPSSLNPIVKAKWYYFMLLFTSLTVVFYTIACILIYYKAHRHSSDLRYIERKALKTLKLLIFLFVMFRFITITIATTLMALGVDKKIIELVQNYNIIAGITTYSQNAYVCYFRSSEYRTLLSEQISMIHPKLGAMLPKLSAQTSVNGQQWIVSGVSIITTNPLKPQKRAHLK